MVYSLYQPVVSDKHQGHNLFYYIIARCIFKYKWCAMRVFDGKMYPFRWQKTHLAPLSHLQQVQALNSNIPFNAEKINRKIISFSL